MQIRRSEATRVSVNIDGNAFFGKSDWNEREERWNIELAAAWCCRTAKNPLTRALAPPCSLCSRAPLRSFVRLLSYYRAGWREWLFVTQMQAVLDHSALRFDRGFFSWISLILYVIIHKTLVTISKGLSRIEQYRVAIWSISSHWLYD